MKIYKLLKLLSYFAVGFTIIHGLLTFVIITNVHLYQTVLYHYSNGLVWYIFFFGLPVLGGFLFYWILKNRKIAIAYQIVFICILVSQVVFTIIAANKNHNYWGYPLKRPAVFQELEKAYIILNCSKVSNSDSTGIKPLYIINDTSNSLDDLYGRQDPYYGNFDRAFMIFQDNAHRTGDLYYYSKIYNDSNRNINDELLVDINKQIDSSKQIEKSTTSYYDSLGKLNGIVTEFMAIDSLKYIFASFSGSEIANDHYPFYEFLFKKNNEKYTLIKKQKFFIDVAGIEGLEYANIAPVFSLLLTIVGLLALLIITLINRIIKYYSKRKQHK